MKIIQEFKTFALKGNVMDMAVGVILGAAFGKIVSTLVADVLMPPLGVMLGGVDFGSLGITLKDAVMDADGKTVKTAAVVIGYGKFINTILDFVIVAFSVFMMIRVLNMAKRKQEAPAPAPTTKDCPQCLEKVPLAAKKCRACASPI